ncbi:MAG: cysteine--tRNA ligase [Candidatus Altiarchaeota archaeon]|nr:cysteine--tRNA ligase [Candidatus Altiarchaeota archaeon]
MSLRIYNTLTRVFEEFTPLVQGEVRVYICGLTVYDLMHIGHARTYIAFDALLRYLKYQGYNVRYIQNITDVDDKIIRRAGEKGVEPLALSSEFAEKSLQDQVSLGLTTADYYPKVSETIPDIISGIQKLLEKGYAYEAAGSVYFDVSKAEGYGMLSHQDTEQLSQHRIEPSPNKSNPLDFALWKKVDDGFGFESPWGYGRPGWHIECTIMSQKHLGDQIDIHGGALDLIFPHHENEVAQSEALTGKKPFVKYWMHTGFLNSSGEKMSKSLGNILSVRKLLDEFQAEVFRIFVLQTHYRSPIDYSRENLVNSAKAFERLRNFRQRLVDGGATSHDLDALFHELKAKFDEAMNDDFQTPKALAHIFDTVKKANQILDEKPQDTQEALKIFDEVMGALGFAPNEKKVPDEVVELVAERNKYRAEKNFVKADEIRDKLKERGYMVKDNKDGTTSVEEIR